MNILLLTPYLPHPESGHGTGVFMYGLLRRLASRHRITLVSFCDDREQSLAQDLRALPITIYTIPRRKGRQPSFGGTFSVVLIRLLQLFRSLLFWQPYAVSKWYDPRMVSMIRRLTTEKKFDIVQFEFAALGQYQQYSRIGKSILHEHDVAFRPAYRRFRLAGSIVLMIAMYFEWCRWARYEPRLVRKFDCTLTVTKQDQLLLKRLAGIERIYYLPRAINIPDSAPSYSSRIPGKLLFVGTFSHQPNLDAAYWLCREIFPLIRKEHPEATLTLIGALPPEGLRAITSRIEGITLLGFVEDVEEYFRHCSIFIAPLRFGGGVKLKILHAMAEGIPIVTTKTGGEGIDGLSQGVVLVGDSSQNIARLVSGLLDQPDIADALGRNGRDAVLRYYAWENTMSKLERIFHELGNG
jgi:glycosyltransferase involved in cell wall biosynthesis